MQGGWARDPHSPRVHVGNKTHPSWKLTCKTPPYQPALAFDGCIITIQMLQLEIPLYSYINLPPSLPYCLQSTAKNPSQIMVNIGHDLDLIRIKGIRSRL